MPTITLTSEQSLLHAIMYAKGHYSEDKNLTGLRHIVSHYVGMGIEYVSDDVLFHFSLVLLEKFKPNANFSTIIENAFKENWKWGKQKDTISRLDIVQTVLSEVRFLTIHELPPLPKANPDIYPLRER